MPRLITCLLLLLLLSFGPSSFGVDKDVYFIANPSFETAASNGAPESWNANPNLFTVVSENARSGNACLKWTNYNKEYRLCTQSIDVKPGASIVFSVWVKTQDLVDGKATICVEWNNAKGEWGGGSYSQGIGGTTNEWTKIEHQTTIPKEATSPHISCYVTQGAKGTAFFDDVEVSTVIPPLFSAATTNLYRAQSIGGNVDVYVGYNSIISDVDFTKLDPQLSLLDADGKEVSNAFKPSLAETSKDFYRFQFDSTPLSVGKYTLTCTATDPRSSKSETISAPFIRLKQFPERKSYIDENKRLITDGKPLFPLGLYLAGANDKEIELIGDSAFNCVMPYSPIARETVDKLYAKGVYTIYSVKDQFPSLVNVPMDQCDERVKQMVAAVKDCPGVVAWYINDELPVTMLKDLTARRDLMEELDPGRPTWIVLYQVEEFRHYLPTFDVAGSDPYPVPSKPISLAAEWTKKTYDSAFGTRAVWQVPQIFDWGAYRRTEEKAEYRAPTFDEMRSMSWQCIAEGANGLVYYSFFDLQRMDKTEADGGRALKVEPFDERWAEIKKVAKEIADQSSILLSAGKAIEIAPIAENNNVSHRLYGSQEGTWLLVVNQTKDSQSVQFKLPADVKLAETRLGTPVKQENDVLSVDLKPYEPRLILVK